MKINQEKLIKIVKNFSGKKILIVGDLMLDEYIFGKTTRLSPEAPVPIVEVEKTGYVPGGAANAANNVRSLGDQTILVGVVGKDETGKKLISLLKKKNIKTDGVFKDLERVTTLKSRIVTLGQHVVRVDKESRQNIAKNIERKLLDFIKQTIKKVDIILLSDYTKGVITPTLSQHIIKIAKGAGKKVLVDPKGDDFTKYSGCFIVTPNLKELETALTITIKNKKTLPQAAKMLLAQLNTQGVLVTMGADGMGLLEKSGKYTKLPATKAKVVDITGAGDTAIATFALSLATGASFYEAMLLSTFACSVVIGKMGTATTTAKELIEAITTTSLKSN